MPSRFWTYECEAGTYYHTSLVGLLLDILAHRLAHFRRGDGWVD